MLPDLGAMTIDEFEREHISDLHHKHRNTPYQANRILEVVRKMFNLAEAWGMRKDGGNPCRFVQKHKENRRERFLTDGGFRKLGQVLNEIEADGSGSLSAVTAIRLLMLTGCRLNEIQTLRWEEVDLETAELRLPGRQDRRADGAALPRRGDRVVGPSLSGRQPLGHRWQETQLPSDRSPAPRAPHPGTGRARRRAN